MHIEYHGPFLALVNTGSGRMVSGNADVIL